MSKKKKSLNLDSRVSRRDFFKKAGVGVAAAAVSGAVPFASSLAFAQGSWDHEVDVVVVGSGAAAFTAAVTARHSGASVLMLEKAPVVGGTTARSGGGYWIPNNADIRAQGLVDPREDALKYMARHSYPHLYNADHPRLGLPEHEFSLLEAYYDNGSVAVEFLGEINALRSSGGRGGMPDYAEHLPENVLPGGERGMYPETGPDSLAAGGAEMIRQLQNWANNNGIEMLLGHRAVRLVTNEDRAVIGIEAKTSSGEDVTIQARRGVVFGTGGYTHNADMMLRFQPYGTYGGCAVPTNEGDFVSMATDIGAKIGNMNGAWRLQVVLDQALEYSSILTDIWQPAGDSMILVNKYGRRVVNEKRSYNERTRAHFTFDPSTADYPNRFLFMVWDQRAAELYANNFPIPPAGSKASYVIQGDTPAELAANIDAHIKSLSDKVGPIASVGSYELSDEFGENLAETIARYNVFAADGVDKDFGRGSTPYDAAWQEAAFSSRVEGTGHTISEKNVTMYPMSETGPYYATILVAGTLDTNGGPVANTNGQILDVHNNPIPGLYGAGNCVAAAAGHSYYGAGATLGPAVTFGYLAGKSVVTESRKSAVPVGSSAQVS